VDACSALACCIAVHMPRIVEVFRVNMKVGDPGDRQLRGVEWLLLNVRQFSSDFGLFNYRLFNVSGHGSSTGRTHMQCL